MSAGGSGAIGPVSVRYAAQIREMLYAQAMQRMLAEQEAARASAQAERAARAKPAPVEETAPVSGKVETPQAADRATQAAVDPKPETLARLVDIEA